MSASDLSVRIAQWKHKPEDARDLDDLIDDLIDDGRELRRVLWVLREALDAERCPLPPIQSCPPDAFSEAWRAWYHGPRSTAMAEAGKVK